MFLRFFDLPVDKPDLPADQRSLYQLFVTAITSKFMAGIGIAVMALLGLAGYFDTPENITLLFLAATINLLDSILHTLMFSWLRQSKLELVAILLMVVNGTLSAAQIFLWQGILWFPITLVLSAVILIIIVRGLSTRYKMLIIAIGVAIIVGIVFANSQISYARLSISNLTNSASLALYMLFTMAMLANVILNGLVNFQTLSRRLVAIFATLAIITILVFVIIGSLVNYLDSRNRVFEQLETISNLKAAQVHLVLENLEKQAAQPLGDIAMYRIILSSMSSDPNYIVDDVKINLIRSHLQKIQMQTPEDEYLLIAANGRVILSTNPDNENLEFSQYAFLKNARNNTFAIEKDLPGSGRNVSLLVLNPLVARDQFVGVLVLRTNLDAISNVAAIVPGTSRTLETYLVSQVGAIAIPTTILREEVDEIDTYPVQQVFSFNTSSGRGAYPNYAGVNVFGHFIWIPELQSVLVSEIDQSEVLAGIANSFPVYLAIGLVMVLLVLIVVFITSQSISTPIQEFAQKAAALAGGELSVRITSERRDEIGVLASSFNTMAGELETTVRTLETKVDERTKDLLKQTNYMRIAAEVARDATTSQDPDELLNRAAQLILDRFNFYHTGIFLVDADREFAVLRASPTEAGRMMLEQGHRLRLGQVGLVGYAAATGTPRIALDTGQDTAYFNNPLLPDTRSEIAIPLKLDNKVLGVLDVQSTQPEAFTQDDVATLQIMADQLALAIQRVDLVSNLQRNFEELENTYKAFTVESWKKFSQEPDFKPGYTFDGLRITRLDSFPAGIREILVKGRTAVIPPQRDADGVTVAAPLKLREQVIGILTIRFQTQTIDADTLSLIEETAGRLAVALENARLYTETQNLVQRERTVSEISSRITTSFNIENILRTAVMEIGKMNPDAEVVVQLEQNKD
jgi:GAF domain-containing protein/HAMP domain-containing protein